VGDAEIHNLDLAVPENKNIGGFDIPVNNPITVSKMEPVTDLDGYFHYSLQGENVSAVDQVKQVVAFQKFHGDKGNTLVFIEFINNDNIFMMETSRRLGFLEKPLFELRIRGIGIRHRLQGDIPSHQGIECFIDDAHGALSNFLNNFVFTKFFHCRSCPEIAQIIEIFIIFCIFSYPILP